MSNRAEKKLSTVTAWENTKKAAIEAKLRSMEVNSYSILVLFGFRFIHTMLNFMVHLKTPFPFFDFLV